MGWGGGGGDSSGLLIGCCWHPASDGVSFVSHSPSVARYVRTPPAAASHRLFASSCSCRLSSLLSYQHLFKSEAKSLIG